MSKLITNTHISEKQSRDMIFMFIEHGDHPHKDKINKLNRDQIKCLLVHNNYPFDILVNNCRLFTTPVPFFENLFGSTFTKIFSTILILSKTN